MSPISIKATTETRKAMKYLKDIRKKDVPAAQRLAMNRAGKAAISESTKRVSRGAGIPQKYMRSRFGKSRFSKRSGGVNIYFRHLHINPAGTKKYPAALSTVMSRTKTGKKTKYYGQLKAIGGHYKDVIVHQGKYPVPIILRPVSSGGNEQVKIPLGGWAINVTRNTVRRVGQRVFKARFKHELKRKIKRRAR